MSKRNTPANAVLNRLKRQQYAAHKGKMAQTLQPRVAARYATQESRARMRDIADCMAWFGTKTDPWMTVRHSVKRVGWYWYWY